MTLTLQATRCVWQTNIRVTQVGLKYTTVGMADGKLYVTIALAYMTQWQCVEPLAIIMEAGINIF